MVQVVSRVRLTAEVQTRSQVRQCEVCVRLSGTDSVLSVSYVSIIPPMLHTLPHLAVTIRTKLLSLETFQKAILFRTTGIIGWRSTVASCSTETTS
jgi:hypothetical protein